MMASSRMLLVLAAAVGTATLAPRPAAAGLGCQAWQCGLNTAGLRGTAIRGLQIAGQVNPDGVRLVPGSVRFASWPSCPRAMTGYSLGVAGGELIATSPPGMPARTVSGACLLNATFMIEVPVRRRDGQVAITPVTLRIAQRGTVDTWEVDASRRATLPTFELIDIRQGASICERKAWMDESADGGTQWKVGTDHAVIVQGETYDDLANVDGERSDASWFNIACAGSAIAKMRLLGYDPMADAKLRGERQATLKMITARYVASRPVAYTVDGTPILYISNRSGSFLGGPTADRFGPPEARWGEHGPLCLSHLRLWQRLPAPTAQLGSSEWSDASAIRAETGLRTCTAEVPAGTVWTTYTVDHVD